jgi:hypothetical protein
LSNGTCCAVCPAGTPKAGECARQSGNCTENGQCCSNVCKPISTGFSPRCCPTCPSGCTCTVATNPISVVCASSEGSGAACSATVACPTGEACVLSGPPPHSCRTLCTPVG